MAVTWAEELALLMVQLGLLDVAGTETYKVTKEEKTHEYQKDTMSATTEGGFVNFTCGEGCNIDKQVETN